MWNKLIGYLEGREFHPVQLNLAGMELYYIAQESSASVIWMISQETAAGLLREQYLDYLSKIRDVFYKREFVYVNVLSLFFTSDVSKARVLGEETMFWIVDERYGRLVVYENQPEDFCGLRSLIEQNLHFGQDRRNPDGAAYGEQGGYGANTGYGRQGGYGANAGYGRQGSYGAGSGQGGPGGYGANGGYGGPGSYGANGGYGGQYTEHEKKRRMQEYRSLQRKHRGYQNKRRGSFAETVTFALIAINVLVFLLSDLFRMDFLYEYGWLSWWLVLEDGQVYRLVTSMFLHGGIEHLGSNMLTLFALGQMVEQELGAWRFLLLYMIAGLCGGVTSVLSNWFQQELIVSFGASGAVYGIAGAVVVMLLKNRNMFGQNSLMRVGIFLVFLFYSFLAGEQGIDHAAHIGGFLSGALICFLMTRRPGVRGRQRFR